MATVFAWLNQYTFPRQWHGFQTRAEAEYDAQCQGGITPHDVKEMEVTEWGKLNTILWLGDNDNAIGEFNKFLESQGYLVYRCASSFLWAWAHLRNQKLRCGNRVLLTVFLRYIPSISMILLNTLDIGGQR